MNRNPFCDIQNGETFPSHGYHKKKKNNKHQWKNKLNVKLGEKKIKT